VYKNSKFSEESCGRYKYQLTYHLESKTTFKIEHCGNITYLSVTFPPEWDALVSRGTNIVCGSAVSNASLSIFI